MDEALQLAIEMSEATWNNIKNDLKNLTPEEFNWRPLPYANNLNVLVKHLRVVEEGFVSRLEQRGTEPVRQWARCAKVDGFCAGKFRPESAPARGISPALHRGLACHDASGAQVQNLSDPFCPGAATVQYLAPGRDQPLGDALRANPDNSQFISSGTWRTGTVPAAKPDIWGRKPEKSSLTSPAVLDYAPRTGWFSFSGSHRRTGDGCQGAGLAQLVERRLAKAKVAGSRPVSRSSLTCPYRLSLACPLA